MGLHFPRERWRELEAGVCSVAREVGLPDAVSCAQRLLAAPLTKELVELLAAELTVGETYFFREARSFAIVGEHILPELIRVRRGVGQRLRIWSAGCCTGEEPYSIAILLDRLLPDLPEWHITLLATDVNPRFLRKAVAGTYGDWSFRDAPPWLKSTYFEAAAANRFVILPRIKRLVTFGYLNLAADAYPSLAGGTNAMDLIFCRNVLMYFPPETARKVVHRFHQSLLGTGWLLLGGAESCSPLVSEFAPTLFDGAVFYSKSTEAALPLAAVLPQEMPVAYADEHSPVSLPTPFARASIAVAAALDAGQLEESGCPPEAGPASEPRSAEPQSAAYSEALVLFEKGEYLVAARTLRTNSAISAATGETATLLARICANLGELTEARCWAERAIAGDKVNAPLHYLRAVILQEQGLTQEAFGALKRALYLAPDFVLAHFALGNLAQQQGRLDAARRHFGSALDLLKRFRDEQVLPHSDGLAAGCLRETIRSLVPTGITA